MVIPELRSIGLTDIEARVYLALLESGGMSVALLSKRIGHKSEQTYDILGSLREKGVITTANQGAVRYFNAVDPRKLVAGFRKRVEVLEEAVPELLSISGNKKSGQHYEGLSGVQNFFRDILKEEENILMVSQITTWRNFVGEDFFNGWNRERITERVNLRILTKAEDFKSKYCQIKMLNSEKYSFPADIVVCNSYIGMVNYAEGGSAVLWQGDDVAETFRSLFEAVWV